VLGQERETEVDVGEEVPPDEAADSDRRFRVPEGHRPQTEPVLLVRGDRAVSQVFARVLLGPDPAVADELEPRRLVDEPPHERRVFRREPPQREALRVQDVQRNDDAARRKQYTISGRAPGGAPRAGGNRDSTGR